MVACVSLCKAVSFPTPRKDHGRAEAVFAGQRVPLGSELVGEPAGDCSPITVSAIGAAAGSSGRRISLDSPLRAGPEQPCRLLHSTVAAPAPALMLLPL